ncbi:MAG TPA: NAD(P)-dependent oxidoreductase, partial [Xanthobacteraceae bacterium]|nr:NAD(P)-dependent oxidoreductase [Xanthobacteraceae bacterium]
MRVGFVGIGAIGWPIAATLVKAGHEVTAFDIDTARLSRFTAESGGKAAANLADVARNEIIITILPTGDDVRAALTEQDGGAFLKSVQPGTTVIDMGSSDPIGTRKLGEILKARGVSLIDAPLSKRATVFTDSGTPKATSTAIPMVIMIGGDDKAALARAKPVLAAIGDTLFETGGLGTGHALKALNNYASAAAHVALAEALLVGKRFGLDPKTFIDVINVSTGQSFVSEVLYKKQLANPDFKAGFSVGLLAKDVKIASDLAQTVGFDAPVARLTRDQWAL